MLSVATSDERGSGDVGVQRSLLEDYAGASGASSSSERAPDPLDGECTTRDNNSEEATPTALRAALRAALESEYNVLLKAFRNAAEENNVSQLNGDLLRAFSCEETADDDILSFDVPCTDADEDDDRYQAQKGSYTVILPVVRSIALNTYIGAKQVRVLADLIRGDACAKPAHGSAKPGMAPYSLLPFLEEIHLSGFTARFDKSTGKDDFLCDSNAAYIELFHALRGHAALRVLNLSGSDAGPALLPSLRQLVKQTPTLCTVDLSDTLLNEREQEGIAAQCLLNSLRQEKLTESLSDATAFPVEQEKLRHQKVQWEEGLFAWLRSTALRIMTADGGTAHSAGRNSTAPSSPYVTTTCTEEEADELAYVLYGRRRTRLTHCSGRSLFTKDSTSPRTAPSSAGAKGNVSSQHRKRVGLDSDSDSGQASDADDFSDAISSEDSNRWDDEGDEETEATAINRTLTLPYIRYRLPREDPYTLSRECVEVIKCAFTPPKTAVKTILGGRRLPRGVPGPLAHVECNDQSAVNDQERQNLRHAMSDSALLSSLRSTLFPTPPKPPSIFGPTCDNPALRTTAEENYYAILSKQEAQWNVILDVLVRFSRPTFLYPTDDERILNRECTPEADSFVSGGGGTSSCTAAPGQGARVYRRGDLPYWLNFLPPPTASASSQASVVLEFPAHDAQGVPSPVAVTVTGGEFFGEVELLSGAVYYADTVSALEKEMTARNTAGAKVKRTHLLKQFQKTRMSDAVLRVEAVPSAAPNGSPQVVWQIPLEVAFFLLNEPYERMQLSVAPSLRLFHLSGHTTLSAQLCPLVACLMQAHVVSRVSTRQRGGTTASATKDATAESDVLAEGEDLHHTLFFLQSGEYTFSSFKPDGKWIERQLFPGNVLIGEDAFAHDAKARAVQEKLTAGANAAAKVSGMDGIAVGKQAALRQFREAKRRARKAASASPETAAPSETTDEGESASASHPDKRAEQMLCLSRLDSAAGSAVWRYYTMTVEHFACLPESTRVAMTGNSLVVPRTK